MSDDKDKVGLSPQHGKIKPFTHADVLGWIFGDDLPPPGFLSERSVRKERNKECDRLREEETLDQ